MKKKALTVAFGLLLVGNYGVPHMLVTADEQQFEMTYIDNEWMQAFEAGYTREQFEAVMNVPV